MTHTPGYGNLIALGILDAVQQRKVSQEQVASAARYRDLIARTGRFLTFAAGAAPIGYRMREDPRERVALRIVRETDAGLVLRGKVAMHTSPAYAEDVYIGSHSGVDHGDHRATFVVAVNAPGVTVLCRKVSARHPNPYLSPLSSRFDELDGQMWLDDVLVPWERVFFTEPSPEPIASWLFWHQLYCWLAKAEFTLGLALACTDAMGLREQEPTIEYLIDLVTDVQTVRSCLTAAELDPGRSEDGYCVPGGAHIAAGSIAMQRARQRMAEILRILPGSSLVVAPADTDLAAPEVAAGLEESFGGGGYTARQRAALLQLAADHVASALDGRESAFELHANGGLPAWRARLRRYFGSYNELANGVLRALSLEMPAIDLDSLRAMPMPQRRPVTPPPRPSESSDAHGFRGVERKRSRAERPRRCVLPPLEWPDRATATVANTACSMSARVRTTPLRWRLPSRARPAISLTSRSARSCRPRRCSAHWKRPGRITDDRQRSA